MKRSTTSSGWATGESGRLPVLLSVRSVAIGFAVQPRGRRPTLAEEPPDGGVLLQRRDGHGVIETARSRGLRVPQDLSVVGFDDIRFARYMDPPLTTIAQPMREIGEGTVRLLLEILRGNAITSVSVTLPHKLVIRASTASPVSSDP